MVVTEQKLSSGDETGDRFSNRTSVNENSLTIFFIIFCVCGFVEEVGLLLGVCTLYSGDGVSMWETEWESSWFTGIHQTRCIKCDNKKILWILK